MVERALKSKSAVSVLNEDFNDIDIYVEDTAVEAKKIYTEILARIFDNQFKIDNIIPLGGCSQVIKEWRSNREANDNRPKIYLMDGDYHFLNDSLTSLLNQEELENHKGLYILPKYCIENYLIDINSFVEIIYEEVVSDDRNTIINKIKFDKWINDNSEILTDLFIYNSICIKYNVGIKTSKYNCNLLQSSVPGICCNILTRQRIEEIKKQIIAKDSSIDVEAEYNDRKNLIENNDFLIIATGKDYLYPLIKKYIANHYSKINQISDSSLKIRLSKTCDISDLKNITENVIQ